LSRIKTPDPFIPFDPFIPLFLPVGQKLIRHHCPQRPVPMPRMMDCFVMDVFYFRRCDSKRESNTWINKGNRCQITSFTADGASACRRLQNCARISGWNCTDQGGVESNDKVERVFRQSCLALPTHVIGRTVDAAWTVIAVIGFDESIGRL